MNKEFIDFVHQHLYDDTSTLLLGAAKYSGIDVPLAVQQIEGLRIAATKWPQVSLCEGFLFPPRLNREQSSSEATATYKASLVAPCGRVADLTGGMGIDTMALSAVASEVCYVEQSADLCNLARHNFAILGAHNIHCYHADSMQWLSEQPPLDVIYIDPSRRNKQGRRVYALDDCIPDVLSCMERLKNSCSVLMIKASPMVDIDLCVRQIGWVSEVHVVSLDGECKEVIFICRHDSKDPTLHAVVLPSRATFSFTRAEEASATPTYCSDEPFPYLFDPDSALLKAGAFRLVGLRWGLLQLSPNTHLYASYHQPTGIGAMGRWFEVVRTLKLNRKSVSEALPSRRASVMSRNFPVAAAELQKQLGLSEGGEHILIATSIGRTHIGLLCHRIQ